MNLFDTDCSSVPNFDTKECCPTCHSYGAIPCCKATVQIVANGAAPQPIIDHQYVLPGFEHLFFDAPNTPLLLA